MRIVQISESVSSLAGGLQYTVRQLNAVLNNLGHESVIIAGRDSGDVSDSEGVVFLDKYFGPRMTLLDKLEYNIKKINPDVVFQHGIWPPFCMQISIACKKLKIPYIIHPHGMLDPFILKNSKITKWLALKTYQGANCNGAKLFRALNDNEKSHINSVFPRAKVFVAPNGVYHNNNIDIYQREVFNNKVLFLGRIDKKKGVLELISAWKNLSDRGLLPIDAILNIAGWAGDNAYLADVHKAVNNCRQISIHGPIFGDEKQKIYRESGAFILPSKGEGLPTTVLEGWSNGCVVLCSKECNFSEEQMANAAICCGNTVEEISSALLKYFNSSDLEKMSITECSRDEIKKYNWTNIAKNIVSEVERVV